MMLSIVMGTRDRMFRQLPLRGVRGGSSPEMLEFEKGRATERLKSFFGILIHSAQSALSCTGGKLQTLCF